MSGAGTRLVLYSDLARVCRVLEVTLCGRRIMGESAERRPTGVDCRYYETLRCRDGALDDTELLVACQI